MKLNMGTLLFATAFAVLPASVHTQETSNAVPPAPVLGDAVGADGRPLPFGVVAYQPEDTPLGSGAHKAILRSDDGLPGHVVYHPADLASTSLLPIIAWGNGGCINAGNRFRYFLTEVASHGYLVIANGPLIDVAGDPTIEAGPQVNPAPRDPNAPPPPPADPNATPEPPRVEGSNSPEDLIAAVDWAIAENAREGSALFGKIDTDSVALMGQSCGGVQALNVADDPRIDTLMIWNSAAGMIPNNPADPEATLASIHTPVAFIYGEAAQEIGFAAAEMNVETINHVPVFGAWQDGLSHLGTFGLENGGYYGKIAVDWLNWQFHGDQDAAKTFVGEDCVLCTSPTWHVTQKGLE